MATLKFPVALVRTIVDHAKAAPEHAPGFDIDGPRRPQIIFVKDDGIYLMSNGAPPLLADGTIAASDATMAKRFVVYAEGYDPAGQDPLDLHVRCSDAVGGDDFAEYFDADEIARFIAQPGAKNLVLKMSAKRIEITTDAPRTVERAAVENMLQKARVQQKLVFFPSSRHKAAKTFPDSVLNRARLLQRYPHAVIITDLPRERQADAYAKQHGVALV